MRKPLEIFTNPINDNKCADQQNYFCRFTNKQCDKQSRTINYPCGVCSVLFNDINPIICPHRFLENQLVFKNVCNDRWGSTNNILLFKEVKLKDIGSFDFVLVKHKELSSEIEDFCIIEFQSDSTTGTGKLVNAMRDFEENREVGNNYAFGLNTYNTIKLSYIQMLMKGNVMESWNKHIYWIMQDCVFNNMQRRFNLNFQNNQDDFSHYHIYDLAINNSTTFYELELKSKYSTSVANLITAFTQIAPNLSEFEKKLKQKVELELGLSVK